MGIGIECSQARDPRSFNYKSYLDDLFIFPSKFLSFERSRSPQDDILDWQDKGKSAILINCKILFRKKNKKVSYHSSYQDYEFTNGRNTLMWISKYLLVI